MLVDAPKGWLPPDLPPDVEVRRRARRLAGADAGAEVVVAFFTQAAGLDARGPELARALGATSALWIAGPRRAAGHHSDITEQLGRDILLPVGVVDVKVAALGEDWSGLKFVWRKELRPGRRKG